MSSTLTALEEPETVADLIERLGGIPPERIRLHPPPGTATEADVLAAMEAPCKRLCELIDGVLVEKPLGYTESVLAAYLIVLLDAFVRPRNLRLITSPDGTVRLWVGRVRMPDVAFFSWDRMPNRRRPPQPIPTLAPDLAVEVLSSSNTPAEMRLKRQDYFTATVRLVWEVDPEARTVAVYTASEVFAAAARPLRRTPRPAAAARLLPPPGRRHARPRQRLGLRQRAYEVIVRGIAGAFDLAKEDARTVEKYDTSKLFSLDEVNKWGDMRRSSNLLGKQMLLARRLVEAGCGFVTVMDAGWDMHSNGNSPKDLAGMQWLGPQVDHAVAAFLEDVRQRGLSDRVLLVVSGEMGRTPKINKNGGRDHWGNLTPLLLAGGGLKMGQVIGQSDRQGGAPVTEKYTPEHLLATVMQTVLDVGQVRVARDLPKNVVDVVGTGKPIAGLF
jgi:Uma2 family endonuclease